MSNYSSCQEKSYIYKLESEIHKNAILFVIFVAKAVEKNEFNIIMHRKV